MRSAPRVSKAAYWSSWAECLQTTAKRQPAVAEQLVVALTNREPGRHLESAVESRERLLDAGFLAPVWRDFTGDHSSPPPLPPSTPWTRQFGRYRTRVPTWVATVLHDIGGMLCQEWPVAPPLSPIRSFVPSTRRALGECTIHLFPCCSPLQVRPTVSCLVVASLLAASSLHLSQLSVGPAACAVAGVLGRRGFALESAAARVCHEAGARVSLDVRV